ncbi:MAG: hypothetical protein VYE22_18680 [Myxococcota bacterium]|nr:hypothetical protein [Myxococcota bacterium]
MGLLDELALGGVDRLERGLGKRAALRALLPLLDPMPPGAGRSQAFARAMGLAAELEPETLEGLCERWADERGARHRDARLLVRALIDGRPGAAARVAEAELRRCAGTYDEASAAYAVGRAREALGELPAALEAYRRAARRGLEQPKLRRAAAIREVRVLWRRGEPGDRDAAARLAAGLLPADDAPPADRLAVAVAALAAPGRYRRAAALDALERLAEGGDPMAVAITAAHVDAWASALDPVEVDRARAVLARHPDPVGAAVAREQLDALTSLSAAAAAHTDPVAEAFLPRARAALEGAPPGPRPEDPRALPGWLGLAALHAAEAHPEELSAHLDEAIGSLEAGARVEAPLWTAAIRAAGTAGARAARLARAAMEAPGEPPPRGYLDLSDALYDTDPELSLALLRRAAARREPDARRALALHLRHAGWAAADAGRRDEAIALLRQAKQLG